VFAAGALGSAGPPRLVREWAALGKSISGRGAAHSLLGFSASRSFGHVPYDRRDDAWAGADETTCELVRESTRA